MYKIDLLSNNPIESIYIKIKRQSCQEAGFSLAKRYFELGTSMKRLTRLLSLLSFSGGPAAQDLWSSPGTDEKKWIASYVLAQNDSSLSIVHGLLEVEGALVQSLPTEKDWQRRCVLENSSQGQNPVKSMGPLLI